MSLRGSESPAATRANTPIPLDYAEIPDQYVSQREWTVINVAGQRFQLDMAKIRRYHGNTLLGHSDFEKLWDKNRSEYFIDRHRATFEVMATWFMRGIRILT